VFILRKDFLYVILAFVLIHFIAWVGGIDFTERSGDALISFVVSLVVAYFVSLVTKDIEKKEIS